MNNGLFVHLHENADMPNLMARAYYIHIAMGNKPLRDSAHVEENPQRSNDIGKDHPENHLEQLLRFHLNTKNVTSLVMVFTIKELLKLTHCMNGTTA